MFLICFLALIPGLFWTEGTKSAASLKSAGIEQLIVPPGKAAAWQKAGFSVTPLSEKDLKARTKLATPGINRNVQVASATSAAWVDGNGWRFRREPAREYWYDLPAGTAPLAAAEAFTYGVSPVLKIDPADLDALGKMLKFLRSLPERTLPDIVDFGFVDDGSPHAGELMNLLSRRNLLYNIVHAADPQLRLNVTPSSDPPNLFAAKVREQLHDDQRSLRIYGADGVLCRLLGDASQARVHILNYGPNPVEGMRLRVRGSYAHGKLYSPSSTKPLSDYAVVDGFTEFSIPELGSYAVVDLIR